MGSSQTLPSRLGSLGLKTEDFAKLTSLTMGVANEYCDGKLVSALEGGYNIPILADCVSLHLNALLEYGAAEAEPRVGRNP
jgi:acetoin utilization deacetylase AcuC-like enzyme